MSMKNFDDYFGGCPRCGGSDGYVNIGKGHWFFCATHKTKWCVGWNLFSSWTDETEEEQRRKYYENGLDTYEDINPLRMEMETLESSRYQDEPEAPPSLLGHLMIWGPNLVCLHSARLGGPELGGAE
jgi:hypothetical protein